MMKKAVCLLSILVLLFASVSFKANAETDNQLNNLNFAVCDVNCDNDINIEDYLCMQKVLVRERFSYMAYENADLNGDAKCNLADVLLLRKYLAKMDVELNNKKFFLEDKDITAELFDLGKNNFNDNYNPWDDSDPKKTVSRNPFDMINLGYRVLVSGGNYNDNTGPVKINYYTNDSDKGRSAGTLDTEQVNRFYYYDNMCFALAIDPRYWGSGSIYILKDNGYSFITRSNVLKKDIHCYDMAKYDGTYFFAGSAVDYDSNYKNSSGNNLEMSKSIIYRFTGSDITKCTSNDFKEVELVNKFGDIISYTSNIREAKRNDGSTFYHSLGVPRIYDFFEWQGNLYALYYNQYSKFYDDYYGYAGKYDFNGLYKYDTEKGQFIYDSSLKIDGITDLFESEQDKEKINHDFSLNGKYYLISNRMIVTDDFVNYSNFVIPNYESYCVRDVIMRSGKYYLLCNTVNTNGGYTNYVLETEDMENFRPILHFNSATYAKSFEFCNGAFYFGLGAIIDENKNINTECGRIYRYNYYK